MNPPTTPDAPLPPHPYNGSERSKDHTPGWKKFVEIGATVASLGLLIVNIFLWSATKTASDAATSAAKTARDALEVGNRPWINIHHRIAQPLTFNVMRNGGPAAIMTFEDTLENIGPSVALNVFHWEEIIPLDPDGRTENAKSRQREWCDSNRHLQGRMTGNVLFPHDPMVTQMTAGSLMTKVNQAASLTSMGPKGKVGFVLVGCVCYRSSFQAQDTPSHETRFMYWLGIPMNGVFMPYISPEGTAKELRLVQMPDGFSAD